MVSVLLLVLPVLVATRVSGIVCPGGEFSCPSHMTCCPLANEHYGCCPFPEATCCSDHVHCCPNDMKCDLTHQACMKNGSPVRFMWQVKVHPELVSVAQISSTLNEYQQSEDEQPRPDISNHLEEVTATNVEQTKCPDGHQCPGSYTCCKMYRGDYGCCPYQEARCCSDGFHCCPHGTHCDESTGGCFNELLNKTETHLLKKVISQPKISTTKKANAVPISRTADADPSIKCPDGHQCSAKSTCCKVVDRGYGCCPYENAVCCSDLIHCCPHGTTCNASTATCDQSGKRSTPSYSLVTGKVAEPSVQWDDGSNGRDAVNGICPDGHSKCPDGNTCCMLKDHSYGCCPLPHATCCNDHEHCCPNGYMCHGTQCYKKSQEHVIPDIFRNAIAARKPEVSRDAEIEDIGSDGVICPDHRSQCPDDTTCCEIESGGYGCCPMPGATCCGDKTHCCPHGYWCADEGCERLPSTSKNLPSSHHKLIIANSTKVHHKPRYFDHLP